MRDMYASTVGTTAPAAGRHRYTTPRVRHATEALPRHGTISHRGMCIDPASAPHAEGRSRARPLALTNALLGLSSKPVATSPCHGGRCLHPVGLAPIGSSRRCYLTRAGVSLTINHRICRDKPQRTHPGATRTAKVRSASGYVARFSWPLPVETFGDAPGAGPAGTLGSDVTGVFGLA